jgi:hypothetical protein
MKRILVIRLMQTPSTSKITVSLDVTPCSLTDSTKTSEEPAASIFRAEENLESQIYLESKSVK